MARQDETTALTSFLYGGNAAYIEDLYARYQANPSSVDAEWQGFFTALGDDVVFIRDFRRIVWGLGFIVHKV